MKKRKSGDVEFYKGPKSGCDFCRRVFRAGEAISVAKEMGMVFCYSTMFEGCPQGYLLLNLEESRSALTTMIFNDEPEISPKVSWMEWISRFWGGLTAR